MPRPRWCLLDIERVDPDGDELRRARVIAHGATPQIATERVRMRPTRVWSCEIRHTNERNPPEGRPRWYLDGEIDEDVIYFSPRP